MNIFKRTFVFSIFSLFFGFAANALVSRELGAELRGNFASFTLIVSLLASFFSFNIGPTYVFRKRRDVKSSVESIYFVFLAFIIFISLGSIFIAKDFLLLYVGSYYEFVFCVLIVIGVNSLSTAFQIEEGLRTFNVQKLLNNFLFFTCVLLLLSFNFFSYKNIIGAFVASNVIVLVFLLLKAKTIFSFDKLLDFNKKNFFEFLKYSLQSHATGLLGIFINNIDKVYLIFFGSMSNLGVYSVAYTFSRLASQFQDISSTVLFSKFAGLSEKEKRGEINFVFRVSFVFGFLFILLICLLANFLIVPVLGPSYAGMYWPFVILLWEAFLGSLSWLLAQHLMTSGKPGLVLIRQFISLFPLIYYLLFFPKSNIVLELSLALIFSSMLRFIITVYILKSNEGFSFKDFLPYYSDFIYLMKKIKGV